MIPDASPVVPWLCLWFGDLLARSSPARLRCCVQMLVHMHAHLE